MGLKQILKDTIAIEDAKHGAIMGVLAGVTVTTVISIVGYYAEPEYFREASLENMLLAGALFTGVFIIPFTLLGATEQAYYKRYGQSIFETISNLGQRAEQTITDYVVDLRDYIANLGHKE